MTLLADHLSEYMGLNTAKQNIYDNEVFFSEYSRLRDLEVNANNLFELPALYSLLPDLEGKMILYLKY